MAPPNTNNNWIATPPWRSIPASARIRIKHAFGVHTYFPTLRPVWNEHRRIDSFRVALECWVCDQPKPDAS